MSFARAPVFGYQVHLALPELKTLQVKTDKKAINLTHLYPGDKILIELG